MNHISLSKSLHVLITVIICMMIHSCAGIERNDSITDYSTTGFVTPDCFQVITKSEPDISSRTLTEKRETSIKTAREQLFPEVRRHMKSYFLSSSKQDIGNRIPEVEKEVENYVSRGYIVCEFHLDDASSVPGRFVFL